MARNHRRERGQAVPLLAALLAVAAVVALVVAELGSAAVHRAQARTAADAAALAGAADGEAAARAVAADNGGRLESFAVDDDAAVVEVEVVVGHGPARARATAEAEVDGSDPRGLAPAVAAAVRRVEQLAGRPVPVGRVDADGLGFEVDPAAAAVVASVARAAGLCRPSPSARPVHFAACPPNSPG